MDWLRNEIGIKDFLFIFNEGRLYGKLFYKIKCRVLIIQDTPIREISEHTFYGINETLQELHVVSVMHLCSSLGDHDSNALVSLFNYLL